MADYYVDINGNITRKKKKKENQGTVETVSQKKAAYSVSLDGTVTRNYEEPDSYGQNSTSGGGITVSGNQSGATSGLTGTGLSAGISKEQQARVTAEENILKQYGSYEQFQQKNATDNKTAAALILAPGATSATKNTLEKAEQGAYEKLIEDETYRLLSESYYAYEQELDDLDSKSQEPETDVLQGLDDEAKRLVKITAEAWGGDISNSQKAMLRQELKERGYSYSKDEIATLVEYAAYDSEKTTKKREKQQEKNQAWAAKQRKNLEIIRGLDSETKELLETSIYGYSEANKDVLSGNLFRQADIREGNKKNAAKALKKKGYSEDEIESLADTFTRAKNANDAKEWRAEVAERVNRSAVDAAANSVGSVFANLGSGAGLIPAATAWAEELVTGEYVPIDTNDPLYRPGEFRDITRTNVSRNIEDSVDSKVAKKILPMLYNAGMSTADTFTASALGGMLGGTAAASEAMSLATMSAGAASSSTQEAFNRTGDTGKALATGIAAGVIEYATEKISLDHAWDIIRNSGSAVGKSWIVNLLAQSGIEGSEETASEIANRIVDDLVNGGMSQYNQNVRQYKDNGEDEKTAEKLATQDFLAQVLDSFSTGALAGLMGGGISTALSTKPSKGAQAVVDAEVDSRIATQEEKTGKKLKMKEKAAIREQVETALAKGDISIDTIEKTLGGETYEKYKAALEQEETLRKEFDTLNKMKRGEMTGEQLDRRAELKEQLKELEKSSNKEELKKQLSREVKELAGNDEFLRESYNEDERRRVAYQIDESVNYSKKQREIVQKAADSGILNNTRRTHEFVDLVARLAADKGVSFDFTDNQRLKESGFAIGGKHVNGFVKDGTITVNIESNQALDTVVGHEITHVLEGTKLYSALQQAVQEYAKVRGEYDSRLAELTELYKGVEGANVENELTAELVGEYLFSDPDFVNQLAKKNRNLFQKLFREIRYMAKIATAGSREAQKLEELKRAFERAYRESNGTKAKSGVQYSVEKFSNDYDAWDKKNPTQVFEVAVTSDALKSIGIEEKSITMDSSKLLKIKAKHPGMTDAVIKNIPSVVNEPMLIMESKQSTSRIVLVGELVDANGKNVLAILELNPASRKGVALDEIKIASAYGKDNLQNFINTSKILYVNPDNTKTSSWLTSTGLQLPVESSTAGSTTSVPQNQQNASENSKKSGEVRYSLSNNSEVTQSSEFKRWFGDWQNNPESASKVVNEDGRPKVVYHGTGSQFTIFDLNKTGSRFGEVSEGLFFFTNKRSGYADSASDYARGTVEKGGTPRIVEAYLNIKNPLRIDSKGYYTPVAYFDQNYEAVYDEYLAGEWDGIIIENSEKTMDDSVIYMVDNPKQIKSATDNIGTFDGSNPDIRYSLSAQDDIAPINPRLTYGNDIALEQDNTIPIRQDIAGKEIAPAQKGVSQYLKPYSEHQKENWKNSKSIVVYENDTQFQNFLKDAKEHKIPGKKMYFGKVADEVAQRVMKELGYDIADYNCSIKADEVEKIFKSHGNEEYENARGQRAVTDNDFKRIPEVMGNPDTIEFAGAYKGKPAIKFVKDGHTIIAVMSDKHLDLYVQTMYIGKKNRSLATPIDESPLSYTPEARSGTAPNDNIPQSSENVTQNIETADSVPIRQDLPQAGTESGIPIRDDIAVEEVRPSESPKTVKEVNQIKRDNYRIELERIQKEAKQVHQDFNEDIAEKQAEYDSKKDKNTKAARDLQRRIDSLKTRRDNADADYERRANKLQEQIAKMGTEEFKRAEQRQTKQNAYRERMRELMGDTSAWVDKKLGISYQVNTLKRNLRDIVRGSDGKRDIARADAIYEELQGKYNHNEALLNREANEIKDKYRKLDINKWEDAYIQMLGEHKYNPDCELTAEELTKFYEKHKEQIDTTKVDAVIEDVRTLYDSLFERVNTVLREQGMKEIGYRQGYFPHFTQDKQGWLAKLLNWKTRSDNIPTDIAGITENFNPERSWQSFNKHRTGDTTDYSFMKGLDSYVNGALDWIYHIEDIQKRRAFENEIRYSHSEKGIQEKLDAIYQNEEYDADEMQAQIDAVLKEAKNPLNNFVTDFRNATNNLAGKKSTADRGMEYVTNRKVYSTMTNLSNRVSANMVGGSISSALTNFIPITQSWSAVSPVSSLKAMRDTIKCYIRDDGMVGQSDFLTNRLNQAENLYESGWDKANKAVGYMMDCIDSFTSQTVWRSKYMENVKSGMEQQEAIRNADNFTEGLMAGRSRGNMPTIFNSKNPLTKMFTAFQLEVANQYGYMFKDMPQDIGSRSKFRLTKGYAAMFIGAYVYNALYSSLTGRDSAFDPIGILEELLKDLGVIGDDDDKEEDLLGAAGNLAENLLDETPFVGGLLGGGRVPISSAFPYDDPVSMVKGTFTDISEGDWKGLTSEWMNPLYYLAMPMGGGQLKKTVQGLSMFDDDLPISGSYTNSGNLRFPVEDTVGNRIQAAIFGQYANKNAREYFDSGQSPLKEKQIQEYKELDIPIRDYWEYREGLKGLDTMEEKTEYIAGLDLPVSKKNILINNASNRKDYIDLTGYENFKNFDEFDFSIKNPAKYEFLKDNDISYEEYSTYENHKEAYDWAYQNQEKFEVAKAAAGGAVAYRKYAKAIDKIEADRNSNGKSVSGSRKKKVAEYINGLNLERGQKLLLYKAAYPSDNSYNQEILDYLNSRKDISYKGMETILKELGFTIGTNGRVYW